MILRALPHRPMWHGRPSSWARRTSRAAVRIFQVMLPPTNSPSNWGRTRRSSSSAIPSCATRYGWTPAALRRGSHSRDSASEAPPPAGTSGVTTKYASRAHGNAASNREKSHGSPAFQLRKAPLSKIQGRRLGGTSFGKVSSPQPSSERMEINFRERVCPTNARIALPAL